MSSDNFFEGILGNPVDDEDEYGELDFGELDDLIVLTDDEGNEISFTFLDLIEYNDEEYAVLTPDDEDKKGEVVILKVDGCDDCDEESYVGVDDEETLNAVYEIFKEKFKNEYNFLD